MQYLDSFQTNTKEKVSRARSVLILPAISGSLKDSDMARSKLEELEEETSRLRQKLDQVTPAASIERPQGGLPPTTIPSERPTGHVPLSDDRVDPHIAASRNTYALRPPNLAGTNGGYPADRVIDGLRVDSQTIVDTFSL